RYHGIPLMPSSGLTGLAIHSPARLRLQQLSQRAGPRRRHLAQAVPPGSRRMNQVGPDGRAAARARATSNSATAAATETLSDSIRPRIGIPATKSDDFRTI